MSPDLFGFSCFSDKVCTFSWGQPQPPSSYLRLPCSWDYKPVPPCPACLLRWHLIVCLSWPLILIIAISTSLVARIHLIFFNHSVSLKYSKLQNHSRFLNLYLHLNTTMPNLDISPTHLLDILSWYTID
jgi:hypothetical protein